MEIRMKKLLGIISSGVLVAVFSPGALAAGTVDWAHQKGVLTSNGAIVVKGVSGSSYTGTQNPSGATVKRNQNAATQPPTVIIQSTAVNRWSMYYKDRAVGLPN